MKTTENGVILVKYNNDSIPAAEYRKGTPSPLGATVAGQYVNFAISVPGAEEVSLRVYRGAAAEPEYVVTMDAEDRTGSVFCVGVRLAGETPEGGWQYDYEAKGMRFVDPYARLIAGRERFGKRLSAKEERMVRGVVRPAGNGASTGHPGIPMGDMILYKLHVRGFTKELKNANAGTYAALAGKAEYLRTLGVNAVLLMPVTEFNECYREGDPDWNAPSFATSKYYRGSGMRPGLTDADPEGTERERKVNFWGYAKHYCLFAPKASYASDPSRADAEFRAMVKKLHAAGIEVLLEMMIPADTNRCMALDALRFWVREYGIDGFRLSGDLVDTRMLATDPYLADTKLLCGGWDSGIYASSAVPKTPMLAEYNDGFLADARRFLKGDEGMARAFAGRVTRSGANIGTINYITDHNGFTLADLYMYDVKHNEANGEHGRDGSDYNHSWNCGAEGPDKRRKIRELRLRMRKNAVLAMLLSQGTPMILAGDEFGNSQSGNNNAYNQDNTIGWVNWSGQKRQAEFTAFVREAIALRKAHPVLHNPIPLRGMDYLSSGAPDVSVHGREAWRPDDSPYNRCVGILLSGDFASVGHDGRDDSFYLVFNMYWEEQTFAIPVLPGRGGFRIALASDPSLKAGEVVGDLLKVPARTIAVLQSMPAPAPKPAARRTRKATAKDTTEGDSNP